jgi:Rod binding domain-containing protein
MQTNVTLSKKSGKGATDRVISEMATFFTVKPGQAEELRQACERFAAVALQADPKVVQKSGLRDSRHVLFDNDQRLLWATTFETEWDPYIDDAVLVMGFRAFVDWMQYTVEGSTIIKSMRDSLTAEGPGISTANSGEIDQFLSANTSDLKRILQSTQAPAVGYWNMLADQTTPQIRKAQRVEAAFQQVLDSPDAAEALSHPTLQPLLEQAAD